MVTTLMMSTKIATPGLLKVKLFLNKGYDVLISVHNVTKKVLSRDSNYIVDMVMWKKILEQWTVIKEWVSRDTGKFSNQCIVKGSVESS